MAAQFCPGVPGKIPHLSLNEIVEQGVEGRTGKIRWGGEGVLILAGARGAGGRDFHRMRRPSGSPPGEQLSYFLGGEDAAATRVAHS
jgi:hypothetical protein